MKKYTKNTVNMLWGTAFTKAPDADMLAFCAGRDISAVPAADEALIPCEIEASIAYARGLKDQHLISGPECDALVAGLEGLLAEFHAGRFHLDPSKEDVHTNVESWLTERLGLETAGKIHTGRSRNEQAIANTLLYLKDADSRICADTGQLVSVLKKKAAEYADVLIPGYTHHQPATVTSFGAMLEAYAQLVEKDLRVFAFWREYALVSPLGAAAGYGTTLPVDKKKIAAYLGFVSTFDNPIQAIIAKGDAESMFVFAVTLLLNHLSSLSETLILFSTREFGFIRLSDAYTTGSSIMPQKKNPDPLEVMKAKASVCQGYLAGILGITKAAFIGYNRDSQWIKYLAMDAVREAQPAPRIMAGIIATLVVNRQNAASGLRGTLLAQAVMEKLIAGFDLPMRLSKMIVETAIKNGPSDRLTAASLNAALRNFGVRKRISAARLYAWTRPEEIVRKELKRGCDMKRRQP